MALSRKDIVATILVAAATLVTYAKLKGFDWPLLGSWRTTTLVLLTLGFGTCVFVGSNVVPTKDAWTLLSSTFGALAVILGIIGLSLGSKTACLALSAVIVVLWLISTTHHMLMTRAPGYTPHKKAQA